MIPQDYKVVNTHTHEISEWETLSRLIHACDPHIGGMNGDVKYLYLKIGSMYTKYAHIRVVMLHSGGEERWTLGSALICT